jgi:hypothetical protein
MIIGTIATLPRGRRGVSFLRITDGADTLLREEAGGVETSLAITPCRNSSWITKAARKMLTIRPTTIDMAV